MRYSRLDSKAVGMDTLQPEAGWMIFQTYDEEVELEVDSDVDVGDGLDDLRNQTYKEEIKDSDSDDGEGLEEGWDDGLLEEAWNGMY